VITHIVHRIGPGDIAPEAVQDKHLDEDITVRDWYTPLETITDGDCFYRGSASTVGRARANASSTMACVAIATADIASGIAGKGQRAGPFHSANYNFSGYVGLQAYVNPAAAGPPVAIHSATSGQLVQSVGEICDQSGIIIQIGACLQQGGGLF
jgi:hypothetical protein